MRRHDLPLLVLQEVGVGAVQHARLAERERPAVLARARRRGPRPPRRPARRSARRRTPSKMPDRVAPAADARDHGVGVAALALAELRPGLVADHPLEVADERGERVRAGDRAEHVVRVAHRRRPIPQRLVDRVLQRSAAGGDRDDLGAEQLHPGDVRRLPDACPPRPCRRRTAARRARTRWPSPRRAARRPSRR